MKDLEKTVFDSPWYKVKETNKGFFYGERKGTDSIAVLPVYWDTDRCRKMVVIRLQPMPLDNSEYGQTIYPCPVTGSLEFSEPDKFTLDQAIYEELLEELGLGADYVQSISKKPSVASTTQMNEVVHNFVVEITEGSWETNGIGDGSIFEKMSCNVAVPLGDLKEAFEHNIPLSEVIVKANDQFEFPGTVGDIPLSTFAYLVAMENL